ncbi:hypothetical protein HK405_005004, partial [Cladochytrium tenue]
MADGPPAATAADADARPASPTLSIDSDINSEVIEPKRFHIFISYRVRTDADLAEKLCDKLQALSILNEQHDIHIKCFLDKQNLTHGRDFQSEFMDGLKSSCLFLPLISEGCLKSMTHLIDGGEDNVVREWETAWDLRSKKEIDIIPVLVGSIEHIEKTHGSVYKRFEAFGLLNKIPEVTISDSPTRKTARETVAELFRLQGIFLNPADIADKIISILNRFSSDVWPKYRPFWAEQDALGAEPSYTCVQCLKDYQSSQNADGSCRFHTSDGPVMQYGDKYTCCGSYDPEAGCTRNRHHNKHHNDFPYGAQLTAVVHFAWPEVKDGEGPKTVKVEYGAELTFGELALEPQTKHELPVDEILVAGPVLSIPVARKRDPNLPAWSSPGCPLRLKVKSTSARHNDNNGRDYFEIEATIVNASQTDVSIIEARSFGSLRLPDDQRSGAAPLRYPPAPPPTNASDSDAADWLTLTADWTPLTRVDVEGEAQAPPPQPQQFFPPQPFNIGGRPHFRPPPIYRPAIVQRPTLPLAVPAGGAISVTITAVAGTLRYGNNGGRGWQNFPLIALRARAPVLVDVELEDVEGRTFAPAKDENRDDADPRNSKYVVARIQATTRNHTIDVGDLRHIVCLALAQNGSDATAAAPLAPATAIAVNATNVLIGEGGLSISDMVASATAYVDPARRCVFAVRMQLTNVTMRSVGYWLLPPYGDAAVAATDAGAAPPRCAPAAVIPAGLLDDGIDWGSRGAPRAMPAAAGADDAALFDL